MKSDYVNETGNFDWAQFYTEFEEEKLKIECVIGPDNKTQIFTYTLEDVYQATKARLIDEIFTMAGSLYDR